MDGRSSENFEGPSLVTLSYHWLPKETTLLICVNNRFEVDDDKITSHLGEILDILLFWIHNGLLSVTWDSSKAGWLNIWMPRRRKPHESIPGKREILCFFPWKKEPCGISVSPFIALTMLFQTGFDISVSVSVCFILCFTSWLKLQ